MCGSVHKIPLSDSTKCNLLPSLEVYLVMQGMSSWGILSVIIRWYHFNSFHIGTYFRKHRPFSKLHPQFQREREIPSNTFHHIICIQHIFQSLYKAKNLIAMKSILPFILCLLSHSPLTSSLSPALWNDWCFENQKVSSSKTWKTWLPVLFIPLFKHERDQISLWSFLWKKEGANILYLFI